MKTFLKDCRWGRFLLLRGDMISVYTDLYGEWSEPEVKLFKKILQPESNVVEIGANLGLHTIPLAKIAKKGKIISFEPQRIIFQMLCANIALNDVINAFAYNAAVSDSPREVEVQSTDYEVAWNYGAFSLTKGLNTESLFPGIVTTENVNVVSLDQFRPVIDLANIDLLKIDAEGHEMPMLSGAMQTIERHRPTIFLENNNEQYGDVLIQRLESCGYNSYWFCSARFQPDNFNRVGISIPGVDFNMACYPKEKDQPTGLMPAKTFLELKMGKVPLVTSIE